MLIIDDINDSGKTIGIIKDLSKHLATKIHFAVLINKSESNQKLNIMVKQLTQNLMIIGMFFLGKIVENR